jgi:CPA2 family monovalent cation:H+ antiporter-2
MNELGLIQDLAIVLLAAGAAGIICRRLGLSVIVGYLVAGIVVGPYTPPFSWVLDVERIQTLSQVGLVFLMFGIGLGLSLGKLRRMGAPTLLATGLGAFFMLNATQLLGRIVGWSFNQSLFIAAMFMVSSSAVIAKVLGELNLMHDRAGQVALSMTVLEDVVAVVMLTILVSHSGGGSANVGTLLTGMSAFVVLLVMAGLLMVPKVLRRLEARADPEIQTIIVAGMLFLLAITAAKAGYSLALGAFLLGAIVAEIPQRASVERAFAGMRDLFSSVFFVSIGMMIEVHLLLGVWAWILGLGLFVLVARPLATGLALILCGTKPHEARRAGLLLSPLGEFSFIIAQLGVAAGVLPKPYYPLAVGVSIFTVLAMPVLNRFGEPIIGWAERAEPRWVSNTFEAYHGWLAHVQTSASGSIAWKLVHGRLVQVAMEMLFITGMMTFSRQMLDLVIGWTATFDVNPGTIEYFFWSAVTLVVLIPLVAIWRNVAAFSMILAEGLGTAWIPPTAVQSAIKAIAALILGYWLYLIVPAEQFGWWGWLAIAVIAVMIVAIFSNRLVYWHSQWQSSVREVLEEGPTDIKAASTDSALAQRERDLKDWKVRLGDCIIPDGSSCGGQTLAELSIPDRFGCVVLEVERNGIVITAIRPDFRVYPGDRLLLMGHDEKLKTIRHFLAGNGAGHNQSEGFNLSVLETFRVPDGVGNGRTLAELQVGPRTGVRVVGIRRGETDIIAPSGQERLQCGDDVLVAGTLSAIGEFRRWLSPGK